MNLDAILQDDWRWLRPGVLVHDLWCGVEITIEGEKWTYAINGEVCETGTGAHDLFALLSSEAGGLE